MKRFFRYCTVLLLFGRALLGQSAPQFDPTNFVVVGGGWAAGYADFQLLEDFQKDCFPSLMAQQMPTIMPLPLFRPLGAPTVVAVNPLPGSLPAQSQTVLRSLPFPLFVLNLSVPYIKVGESLGEVPALPIAQEGDLKQTLLNLVVGYPLLILDSPPSWTQVQYAETMAPTFVIIQLGLGDVLEAALTGDASRITPSSSFATDFGEVARRIRNTFAQVLVLSVPDPTDMPYFSDLATVAQIYRTTPEELQAVFGLAPGNLVTVGGLVQIGDYLRGRRSNQLTPDAVLDAGVAGAISSAVDSYNQAIQSAASSNQFVTYDLHALVREVRENGIEAGSRHLGGGYLEGFYSPDGLFPTAAAQGVLANELLALLNSTYRTSFPPVDIDALSTGDPPPPVGDLNSAFSGSRVRNSRAPSESGVRNPGRVNR